MSVEFNPVAIIKKKREGEALSEEEIRSFILSAAKGIIPDYQVSAFLMAVFFQGMDSRETSHLTKAMIASGTKLSFPNATPGTVVDKHSTGGIGDKVSLILAPLAATLGLTVPMVAGRGLGHTGGTLDKLESIPGFDVKLKTSEFQKTVESIGTAIMGQTEEFVPADKLLYSLRDVTATVDCIPLMTASILSKKVAEGITGLVIDLKVGSGAFMKTLKEAEKLAKCMIATCREMGVEARAMITDMNQPLGNAVGHSLEVLEAMEVLKGEGPSDLREITVALTIQMLLIGGKASSCAAARKMIRQAMVSGAALRKFQEMCRAQKASVDVTQNPGALKKSAHQKVVSAWRPGRIAKMDGEKLGYYLIELGGGRKKVTDKIDYGVGFIFHQKIGDEIKTGSPLVTVHYNKEADFEKWMKDCITINQQKTSAPILIKKILVGKNIQAYQ